MGGKVRNAGAVAAWVRPIDVSATILLTDLDFHLDFPQTFP